MSKYKPARATTTTISGVEYPIEPSGTFDALGNPIYRIVRCATIHPTLGRCTEVAGHDASKASTPHRYASKEVTA